MNQNLGRSVIRTAGAVAGKAARDPLTGRDGSTLGGSAAPSLLGPKIKRRDLVNLTSQLAIMTQSGVDLSTSLSSIVRQCQTPALQEVLRDVHQRVVGGSSVSESMQPYAHVFSETYVASIAAGEASGQLPEVLRQLAELMRSQLRLRSAIQSMLAYPVILMSVSGAVLLALVLYVLPRFAEIFTDFDAPLPIITQLLIDTSDGLRHYWWLWTAVATGIVGGLTYFFRSERGRWAWDHFLLHAPLCGDISRALFIGRSCRLMAVMLDSGVPLLDAIRLVRSALNNSLYRQLFDQLEDDVLNGRGMSSSMLSSEIIPSAASEIIVTAEQTGNMASVTRLVGQHFEEEAEGKLRSLVAISEPVITVVMGVAVAVIVASVMLPLFDISSAVH